MPSSFDNFSARHWSDTNASILILHQPHPLMHCSIKKFWRGTTHPKINVHQHPRRLAQAEDGAMRRLTPTTRVRWPCSISFVGACSFVFLYDVKRGMRRDCSYNAMYVFAQMIYLYVHAARTQRLRTTAPRVMQFWDAVEMSLPTSCQL